MHYVGTRLELQRDADIKGSCLHYKLDMGMSPEDAEGMSDRWIAHIDWSPLTSLPQKGVDLLALRLFELLKESFEQPNFYVVDSSRSLGKYDGILAHVEDTLEGFVMPGTQDFWNYMSEQLSKRRIELRPYKGKTGMLIVPAYALGNNK